MIAASSNIISLFNLQQPIPSLIELTDEEYTLERNIPCYPELEVNQACRSYFQKLQTLIGYSLNLNQSKSHRKRNR